MRINFVNFRTGEIRQVHYKKDNDKYSSIFRALRRKNIQAMFKELGVFDNESIIIDNPKGNIAIEFIEEQQNENRL